MISAFHAELIDSRCRKLSFSYALENCYVRNARASALWQLNLWCFDHWRHFTKHNIISVGPKIGPTEIYTRKFPLDLAFYAEKVYSKLEQQTYKLLYSQIKCME